MNIKVFFAWYDLWVGVYIDTKQGRVYICPLPMLVIRITYSKRTQFVENLAPVLWYKFREDD